MDLNPYVFSIDMPRSNLCFLFKKRHTISDSWITRLQINLIARYKETSFCTCQYKYFRQDLFSVIFMVEYIFLIVHILLYDFQQQKSSRTLHKCIDYK
jgi:hypothetical protein